MLIVGLLGPVNAPLSAADNGFDKVIFSQEYTFGLGGMTIIEFRPYLLFKDGSIMRSPSDAPADLDVSRSRAARPKDWGRFAITSDRIQVQWGDGKSQTIENSGRRGPRQVAAASPGCTDIVAAAVTRPLGRSAMVVRSNQYRFNTDGTFSSDTFGGGSNKSLGVQTAAGSGRQGGGSYHLDGYTIELTDTDGRVERLLFCGFGTSRSRISHWRYSWPR